MPTNDDLMKTAIARMSGKPHATILSTRMLRLQQAGRVVLADRIGITKVAGKSDIKGYSDVIRSFEEARRLNRTLPITTAHLRALEPLQYMISAVYEKGGISAMILTINKDAVKEYILGGIPSSTTTMAIKDRNLIGVTYSWNGTAFV